MKTRQLSVKRKLVRKLLRQLLREFYPHLSSVTGDLLTSRQQPLPFLRTAIYNYLYQEEDYSYWELAQLFKKHSHSSIVRGKKTFRKSLSSVYSRDVYSYIFTYFQEGHYEN